MNGRTPRAPRDLVEAPTLESRAGGLTYTSPAHFGELRWLSEQLERNACGLDADTLSGLLDRQAALERRAVEDNIILDLNGAIRGDAALGAYRSVSLRLRRREENRHFAASGWRMPWDHYPADSDETAAT